jgi:RNA recognition motif-containing protein
MGNRLYVGNLPFSATAEDLRAAFEAHGAVSDVHVVMDRDTGRSRGFAFVTMGTDGEAATAIQRMDGKELDGRALRVSEAAERTPRPGGGFGGGGGGRGRGGDGGHQRRDGGRRSGRY